MNHTNSIFIYKAVTSAVTTFRAKKRHIFLVEIITIIGTMFLPYLKAQDAYKNAKSWVN